MKWILVLCLGLPVGAQGVWRLELLGGDALHLRTPLRIRQEGHGELRLRARYETRPFKGAPYYVLRIGRWEEGRAWEAELVHHKLYLQNPPREVQHFEISHGYNLLFLNRAWAKGEWILRAGGGLVVAHPESTIRGRTWAHGYVLAGPAMQAAAGRTASLGRGFFLSLEIKLTLAQARVPVEGGRADVPNAALHGLLGVGRRF